MLAPPSPFSTPKSENPENKQTKFSLISLSLSIPAKLTVQIG